MSLFISTVYVPSKVVRAMINGLHHQDKRPDFIVNMDTVLDRLTYREVCIGNAATCAVQEIFKYDITPSDFKLIMPDEFNPDVEVDTNCETSRHDLYMEMFTIGSEKAYEIIVFESLVYSLSVGNIVPLLVFYKLRSEDSQQILGCWEGNLPILSSHDWHTDLADYETLAKELEDINL